MGKFKVGDRVVLLFNYHRSDNKPMIGKTVIIQSIEGNDGIDQWYYLENNEYSDSAYEDHLELEEIWNSSLYKALEEK